MKFDFSHQMHKKIAIKNSNGIQFFDIHRILYLKCDGYVTTIIDIESNSTSTSKLLKEFEIELIEFGFIRANRSILVNMAVIKKYIGGSKRILELINGEQIEISRRRVYVFKNCHL